MKTKIMSVFVTALTISFLWAAASAQTRLDLKNKAIKNALLVDILNNAEMTELDGPGSAPSHYVMRLYSIGELGDCEPATETEVTCSLRYYLSVNGSSLGVPGAVFDLGEVGEITKIERLPSPNAEDDRLRLEISNYPARAFENNPNLVKKTRVVQLDVSLKSIKIKAIK